MRKIIIDLTKTKPIFTAQELLDSPGFSSFLESYFADSLKDNRPNSSFFLAYQATTCIFFFQKVLDKEETTIRKIRELDDKNLDDLLNLIDSIYDYWRKTERYLVFIKKDGQVASHREFVMAFTEFSNSIVDAYRDLYETVLGHEQTVYRVLPSGGNAGVLLAKENLPLGNNLDFLKTIPLMESVVTQPPFIIKTKQNTRKGFFYEKNSPVKATDFDYQNSYGVLIRIYDVKGVVYFDKDYMGFLISLGNLFQVESYDPKKDKDISFIVLFGCSNQGNTCFYYKENDKYIGVLPKDANIDYFGYAKKMVLTLFNLLMIERKLLPIHGAGVKIRMNGRVKNLFLLGDSGAGKSETLETIRNLYGDDYQVDTIFDDMGTFHLLDGKVYASGTEIGAFVRLDDLDQGYSLRSADRAVYLNIDEANSRVVIPIEDFEMTYTLHPVDCLLLADNYTDNQKGITLYSNPQEAMADFIAGKRMAMNTTSEKGLVSTFFANPFGPMQKEKEVRTFLPDYFNALFKNNVPVGKIYTRLSLDRKEGPVNGAKSLIELFKNL